MQSISLTAQIATLLLLLPVSANVLATVFPRVEALNKQAQFKQALQLIESKCNELKKAPSTNIADCFSLQGQILLELADFNKSEPLFKQALSIRESLLGKDHADVAASLNDLGELYRHRGEYEKPEVLYLRALKIRIKQFGKLAPKTAEIYKNLGELYHDQGDYDKAEKFYTKASRILEEANDKPGKNENELALAEVLNWQGMLYQEQDILVEAEIFYQRSIDSRYRLLGEKHPHTLDSLMNLTSLYLEKGDYDLSFRLAKEIEAALESIGYTQQPDYAYVSGILAEIYTYYNLNEKSEQYYQRIVDIYRHVYGDNNIMTAYSYSDLGWLNAGKARYEKAKEYFEKALKIRIRTLSPIHQEVASSKRNLAWVALKQGDLQKSETLLQEAIEIFDATLGNESIAKADALYDLSVVKWQQGQLKAAIEFMSQAEKNQELEIQRYLSTGSERQKIAYMNTLREVTNYTLSLHLQADVNNNQAAKLAFKTILRRKGRVIDVLTEHSIKKLLPSFPIEIQKQVVDWQNSKQQLAELSQKKPVSLSNDDYVNKLSELRFNVDVMSSVFESIKNLLDKYNSQTIEINEVAKLIPNDYLLLEFIIYQPFKVAGSSDKSQAFKKWGKNRLAAYTLDNTGKIQAVDLGEITKIKRSFNIARRKLSTPTSQIESVNRSLNNLDKLLFDPIIPLLGEKKKLLIAPDGFLNLLPFSALVDNKGQYRGDQFYFSYLTSGRDLLSMHEKKQQPVQKPSLIIANPNFDSINVNKYTTKTSTKRIISTRSGNFDNVNFEPLPYTEEEANELKKIIPNVHTFLAEDATEEKIKSEQSPYILHIATHGFFNSDTSDSWSIDNNPLLNSGLALSGANKKQENSSQDGILTALEITGLDLTGTALVVLSACETGVGVVENGQGLYGLRRALVLAGSSSQLLSLWKVSDKVTKEMMSLYYKNLFSGAGQGRAEAIYNTRISIRKQYPHPFYWSSFIPSGDWRRL